MANDGKGPGISPAAVEALAKGDLANYLVASTPGGIEAQEARGQTDFVAPETLPIDGTKNREDFEAMGIQFGESVDDIFVSVTLPEGWKKVPTDHSMWSHLVDDQDRKRASIFYKAAFYDRSAHIRLNSRYVTETIFHPEGDAPPTHCELVVRDTADGAVLFSGGKNAYDDFKGSDGARLRCNAWLKEHFPDWDDLMKYWD